MEEIKTPSEIKPPVNGTGKTILGFLLEGLLIWLTLFVVNEIIISGGRYEKNIYLLVINLILTVFLIIIIGLRRKSKNSIEVLKRGVIYLISNFVLDFLIVNLILQANSLSLFKSSKLSCLFCPSCCTHHYFKNANGS